MLKVKETLNIVPVNIEFDMYIPINIEFGLWDISLEPTKYWRTGDLKRTLIEIGIGSKKGIIRSITLTQVYNIHDDKQINISNKIPVIEGIPVLEIENDNENIFTDEFKDFDVVIDNDKLYILFSHNEIVGVIKNDRLLFGLDKNHIVCVIAVSQLTPYNKSLIMQSI